MVTATPATKTTITWVTKIHFFEYFVISR